MAVDVDSGMIRVVPAPGKNVSDYLVTGLRKFVESTFHTKVRLRYDNEPAAIIIAERVKALLPSVVVLENTPRHDHAANPAEMSIRSVEDQVRVLRPDVFEASLRDLHAKRSCDSKGGRLCCEQTADWENSFFFSGGNAKFGHYCFSSSCCARYAGSAYQKHYDVHDCRGMCGEIGNPSFVCGAFPLPLHRP